jgi:hypothetical protein
VGIVLYVLTGVPGLMTMLESVARHRGLDMAVMQQVRITFTALVLTGTAVMLAVQIWLWPLWRHRRQLLLRYVEPELVQLRNDLLNLSAAEAELHLDLHHEDYANHTIVEAVAARCRSMGISPARTAMARMATSLITFHRDNVIQDTSYGLVTSWEALMAEAAEEIDQAMALTAWKRRCAMATLPSTCIASCSWYWRVVHTGRLLIDERPRVEAWHSSWQTSSRRSCMRTAIRPALRDWPGAPCRTPARPALYAWRPPGVAPCGSLAALPRHRRERGEGTSTT